MFTVPQTPQTPSPTLQSPIGLNGSAATATPTVVNDEEPSPATLDKRKSEDKLDGVFRIHDLLVKDAETSRDFPFVNIVSVGGQSAGKSTVLSAISGIPLYSATKTATICPIQIHSRTRPTQPFTAMIELEAVDPISGRCVRVPFNSEPLHKSQVALATRMAQYEARRCGDDLNQMTTYEALQAMPQDQRDKWLATERKNQSWTANTVILHVSGTAQPNISIIDLPGLMGGENGQFTRALVEGAINARDHSQNIILVCAAGSGSDLSQDQPAFELARKHDPTGSRTICAITKSDLIDSVESIEDLVLGKNPNWDWKPNFGFWPISPRTTKENERNVGEVLVRAREAELFRDDQREAGWAGLQRQAGRTFGTPALRVKLYAIFEDMVMTRVQRSLRASLRTSLGQTDSALSRLPPEETDPVGHLHKIVVDVWLALKKAVKREHKFSTLLFDIQRGLNTQLAATLPVFVPFFEGDSDAHPNTYEPPQIQGWSGDGSATQIWMDEVLASVRQCTSGRDRSFALAHVRHTLLKKFAARWDEVCRQHTEAVWSQMTEAIGEVVAEACEDKVELQSIIKGLLEERQKGFEEATRRFAAQLCERELDDPAQIDVVDERTKIDYNVSYTHFDAVFAKVYGVGRLGDKEAGQTTPGRDLVAVESLSGKQFQSSQISSRGEEAPQMTTRERKDCFTVMASVTAWSVRGVIRLTDLVGREYQAQAMDSLGEIMPTLRKGLGLERVERDVAAKSATVLEPDPAVVAERLALRKRKRELMELSETFSSVYEDF